MYITLTNASKIGSPRYFLQLTKPAGRLSFKSHEVLNVRFFDGGCDVAVQGTEADAFLNASAPFYNTAILTTAPIETTTSTSENKMLIYTIEGRRFESNRVIYSLKDSIYNAAKPTWTRGTNSITKNIRVADIPTIKSGFVRWGYDPTQLFDKEYNALKLSTDADTDLYRGRFLDTPLMVDRQRLIFKCCQRNATTYDEEADRFLSELAWCYVYMQPGTYTSGGPGLDLDLNPVKMAQVNYDSGDVEELTANSNTAVLCFPIYRNPQQAESMVITPFNKRISSAGFEAFLKAYPGAAAKIYATKVSSVPPFNFISAGDWAISGNTLSVINPSARDWFPWNDMTSADSDSFLVITRINIGAHETHSVGLDMLQENGWPLGCLIPYYRYTADDLRGDNNPYVQAHSMSLSVSDGAGNSRDFNPLELGFIRSLKFKVYETFTPDVTKCYVVPDTAFLDNSTFNKLKAAEYGGLIADNDMSYPYTATQLDAFLAQNKNFFAQKMTAAAFSVATGGVSNAVGAIASGIDTALALGNKEAVKSIEAASGNMFMTLALNNVGYFVTIKKATQSDINSLLEEFCLKGININAWKYGEDAEKLWSVADNRRLDLDKVFYKYIEGDFDIVARGNRWDEVEELRGRLAAGVVQLSSAFAWYPPTATNPFATIDIKEFN